MSNSVLKKVDEYYNSYRDLFLRTRSKAHFFRRASKWINSLYTLVNPFIIPILPGLLWVLCDKFGYEIKPWPIHIDGLYFVSWWLSLITLAGIFLIIISVLFYFYYEKQKFQIIRRIKYPFCLLKECSRELKSFQVNEDQIRLSTAIEYLYEYTVIERRSDLVVMRPLGGGNVSVGISRKRHDALRIILEEEPWIKVTSTSSSIGESLDFFYEDSVDYLRLIGAGEKLDLTSLIKAIDFLAVHEYFFLHRSDDDARKKYSESTYLKKFSSSLLSPRSSYEEILASQEIETPEETEDVYVFSEVVTSMISRIRPTYWMVLKYFSISFLILLSVLYASLRYLGMTLEPGNVGSVIIASATLTMGMTSMIQANQKKSVLAEIELEEEE